MIKHSVLPVLLFAALNCFCQSKSDTFDNYAISNILHTEKSTFIQKWYGGMVVKSEKRDTKIPFILTDDLALSNDGTIWAFDSWLGIHEPDYARILYSKDKGEYWETIELNAENEMPTNFINSSEEEPLLLMSDGRLKTLSKNKCCDWSSWKTIKPSPKTDGWGHFEEGIVDGNTAVIISDNFVYYSSLNNNLSWNTNSIPTGYFSSIFKSESTIYLTDNNDNLFQFDTTTNRLAEAKKLTFKDWVKKMKPHTKSNIYTSAFENFHNCFSTEIITYLKDEYVFRSPIYLRLIKKSESEVYGLIHGDLFQLNEEMIFDKKVNRSLID